MIPLKETEDPQAVYMLPIRNVKLRINKNLRFIHRGYFYSAS